MNFHIFIINSMKQAQSKCTSTFTICSPLCLTQRLSCESVLKPTFFHTTPNFPSNHGTLKLSEKNLSMHRRLVTLPVIFTNDRVHFSFGLGVVPLNAFLSILRSLFLFTPLLYPLRKYVPNRTTFSIKLNVITLGMDFRTITDSEY